MNQETFQYIVVATSSITALGLVIAFIRGVVTKKDLKEHKETCYNGIQREFTVRDEKLDRGDDKFKEINSTLTSQGKEITSIGSTLKEMSGNVKSLVEHHIGGK